VSFFRGQGNANVSFLLEHFGLGSVAVEEDAGQARGILVLESGPSRSEINCSDRP
jgi:hypothetical protein